MHSAIEVLLLMLLVSGSGGAWLAGRKSAEKPVKIMFFVGYFWLLTFVQLCLAALGYFLGQRFSF